MWLPRNSRITRQHTVEYTTIHQQNNDRNYDGQKIPSENAKKDQEKCEAVNQAARPNMIGGTPPGKKPHQKICQEVAPQEYNASNFIVEEKQYGAKK